VNRIIPYSRKLVIAWAILIFILSLLPPGAIEMLHWNLLSRDKLLHTIFYSIFSILVNEALGLTTTKSGFSVYIRAFLICTSYGILMECLQYLENLGRIFDAGDILANTFGTGLGIICYKLIKHFKA